MKHTDTTETFVPINHKFDDYTKSEKMEYCHGYIDLLACLEILDYDDIDSVDYAIVSMAWNKARQKNPTDAYIDGAVKFYEMHADLIEKVTQISVMKSMNKNSSYNS